MGGARTGSCHFQSVSTQAEIGSYGSGKNQFLPFSKRVNTGWNRKLWGVARTGTCHFQSVLTQAEIGSYGEWQEPVLAISSKTLLVARTDSCHLKNCKKSQQRLYCEVMVSGKNWFLPFSSNMEWQEPVLAIFKVIGSGKNRFLPFPNYWEWQEPVLSTSKIANILNTGCITKWWWVARTGS